MQTQWRLGRGLPITAIYAWLATCADGSQSIAVATVPVIDAKVPLVGADLAEVRAMRPFAELHRLRTGCVVRLIRFNAAKGLEELP